MCGSGWCSGMCVLVSPQSVPTITLLCALACARPWQLHCCTKGCPYRIPLCTWVKVWALFSWRCPRAPKSSAFPHFTFIPRCCSSAFEAHHPRAELSPSQGLCCSCPSLWPQCTNVLHAYSYTWFQSSRSQVQVPQVLMQSKKGVTKRLHGTFGAEWVCSQLTCSPVQWELLVWNWTLGSWDTVPSCQQDVRRAETCMEWKLIKLPSNHWIWELPVQCEPAAASGSQPAALK